MTFAPTQLEGSYIIDLLPFSDSRGWFARTYCKEEFMQIGHNKEWLQINHSFTFKKGTIRGMHFQVKPFKEIKLIRCVAGTVYDVIVDLRYSSPTFLNWFGIEISAKNKKMIYIPEGFAHGFQAMTDECELIYHHSEIYKPEAEAGINFSDPRVNIDWPLSITEISERDKYHPYLDEFFKGI
jgi:dTDP-4-dehydrorhamnose 3,5-epimerase